MGVIEDPLEGALEYLLLGVHDSGREGILGLDDRTVLAQRREILYVVDVDSNDLVEGGVVENGIVVKGGVGRVKEGTQDEDGLVDGVVVEGDLCLLARETSAC